MDSATRKKRTRDKSSDTCVKFAVALQDHLSRTLQLPGPQKPPSLAPGSEQTLAQRFGLYPKPDRLLTQGEWEAVHGVARQRQDCLNACAVCLEAFKNEQQVLLSCSHVFHAQCLESFEQHARVRACPLCRKQWYQKHVIRDAAEAYQHVCATRIQAVVRGWLCRKHLLLEGLRHAPPQAAGLKRQWAAGRLSEAGHALNALVQQGQDSLEQLFNELDASLQAARQIINSQPTQPQVGVIAAAAAASEPDAQNAAYGLRAQRSLCPSQGLRTTSISVKRRATGVAGSNTVSLQQHHHQHQHHRCITSPQTQGSNYSRQQANGHGTHLRPDASTEAHNSQNNVNTRDQLTQGRTISTTGAIPATSLQQGPLGADLTAQPMHTHAGLQASEQGLRVDDWAMIISRACHRGETECAICLCPLARRQQEGVALLSCSHTFHMQCIVSFEQFEQGRGGSASCPVCRATYGKMCFAISTAADQ